MPDEPRVSVVIPAYNCEQYLGGAIESVLGQTIGANAIDLLVLDDGSTDGTADVVRRFGTRVRFAQLRHGGGSAARNTGIRMAYAPLIAFLDPAGSWLPARLERICELFQRESRIFATSDFYLEAAGNRSEVPYYQSRGMRALFDLSAASQIDFAVEEHFINPMVAAPRDALISAGGFNERLRYGEDWDLWLRLLQLGYAVRLAREPAAVYRRPGPGAAACDDARAAADRLFVLSQCAGAVSPYRMRHARAAARRLQIKHLLGKIIPAYHR